MFGVRSLAAAISLLLAVGVALPAHAADNAKARGDWRMVPQSKDVDGDGFIDGDGGVPAKRPLGAVPSPTFEGAGNQIAQPAERLINGVQSWYLNPRGYAVTLDACKSQGNEYQWRIYRGKEQIERVRWRKLTKKTCKRNIYLQEGSYRFKLEVRSGASDVDFQWMNADVIDYLFVILGDSYASGDGNPRNIDAWLRDPNGDFDPYYDDVACKRSVHAGPVQAALELENSSKKSSVTVIDVSCSGATILTGVLGPFPFAGQETSQIEQVQAIIGNRPIDIVALSAGGNDIGFTSILSTCALSFNCPVASASTLPLSRFDSVNEGVQTLTGRLPAKYAQLAGCLGGASCTLTSGAQVSPLTMADGARVLPMTYPDITRSAVGEPCRYLTLSPSDFAWARDTVLALQAPNPYLFSPSFGSDRNLSTANGTLNGQILATAALGWEPVAGIWGASGESTTGHGVCAGDKSWVFGVTTLSGPFASAAFHPNPAGQRSMGRQIARTLGLR
ncbi:MAG: hypothetical protein K0U48_09790 [Actinomycetia bacterium]|nr:hypothetical protein [Actinomycetes bacterium]